jgi:transcriptional regulator of acetoin/glycerol metabolism
MRARRDAIHAEQVYKAVAAGEAARSKLVASWQRSSRLHALDPAANMPTQRLTAAQFAEARERIEPLLRVAQASLDRLFKAVGGVGCSVLLANRDGVTIERRGATCDDVTFRDWGLWTGAVWSEGSEGTNGIGTCLVEKRALTIHRDQHFFARNALLSCSTAPIFDERGELAAAIDVSSCRADLTEGFSQLIVMAVADAARRIETENFQSAFPGARIILAETGERAGVSLLAVDRDDLVIGATRGARIAFGISAEILAKPRYVADVIGGGPGAGEKLDMAERAIVRRALARSQGNISEAAKALGVSRSTLHRKLNQLGVRQVS